MVFSCAVFSDVLGSRKSSENTFDLRVFATMTAGAHPALAYKIPRFCLVPLFQRLPSPGRSRHALRQMAVPNAARGFANTLRGRKQTRRRIFPPPVAGGQRYVSAISYVFASLIRAKFSDPGKLRRAPCERAFSDQMLTNHPHDLEKTQLKLTQRVPPSGQKS